VWASIANLGRNWKLNTDPPASVASHAGLGWLPQAVVGGVGNGSWIKKGSRNVVLGAAQSTHCLGQIWINSLGHGAGIAVFKLRTQADSHNSIYFGGRSWGAYLRRKDLPLPVMPRIRVWATPNQFHECDNLGPRFAKRFVETGPRRLRLYSLKDWISVSLAASGLPRGRPLHKR
jgi:hypothetical protein